MKTIWVRHPVTGGEAEVPESALPTLRQSGWEPMSDKDVAAKAKQAAADLAAVEKAMQDTAAGNTSPAVADDTKENG